jgi:hypothetical protein
VTVSLRSGLIAVPGWRRPLFFTFRAIVLHSSVIWRGRD